MRPVAPASAALFVAFVFAAGAANPSAAQESAKAPGGAFNLRILSDSVPDRSARDNIVRSALSAWKTDQEKALAQFRWMHRCRRVGSYAPEDNRPVLDPILFFNSYGVTFCSMISEMNCSLWEARGLPGRCVNLPGHVVSEVFYDNAWHMYDNDFCNYYLTEKGEVAGAEALGASRIHGNVQDLKPGEWYLFDHCPTASSPRGRIFMGPSSWSIIEVARDWYPNPKGVRPRLDFTGSHAGHRYILGIRPNETYTRHWRPLGTGTPYARPFRDGKDPAADGTVLRNSRSNGEWTWSPDPSDPSVLFASENIECTKDGIKVKDPAKPASATFRVMAANVVTSAGVNLQFSGSLGLSVSGNGGMTWEPAGIDTDEQGVGAAVATASVAGRLEYLLKVHLGKDGVLGKLTVNTITQVNPRTLPALKLGRNEIVFVSDEPLEYVTFNPRLSANQHAKEVFKAEGWQSLDAPRDWNPSLSAKGAAELVLRAAAPRDVRHVRMACTAHLSEPAAELDLSVNAGKTWLSLAKFEFDGAPYDRRLSAETRKFDPGAREVLLRYAFDDGGSGLVNVFAEVGYEPAGGFMPCDVTYSWSEWRGGKWVERRHLERVANPYHKYAVNVGGDRPPRMNYLRVEPATPAKTGYSDGEDVADRAARPAYRLTYGENISVGCKYEVSRPDSAAFPDVDGKLLTDGYVSLASFWSLGGIDLVDESKRNKKRIGELAAWGPGDELAVTIDLGKTRDVGGARICAVQANPKVLFPAKMAVETSTDGREFKPAGDTTWEACFFPPADEMLWEGTDSPVYDDLPAGGMLDHKFPVLFDQRKARYVRFRLTPADCADKTKSAIALWELQVFDRIDKSPWDERLTLPAPPAAKRDGK